MAAFFLGRLCCGTTHAVLLFIINLLGKKVGYFLLKDTDHSECPSLRPRTLLVSSIIQKEYPEEPSDSTGNHPRPPLQWGRRFALFWRRVFRPHIPASLFSRHILVRSLLFSLCNQTSDQSKFTPNTKRIIPQATPSRPAVTMSGASQCLAKIH